jgi:CRISPR-associated protein Cas2
VDIVKASTNQKTWLLAYDIANPRRLQHAYAQAKRHGTRLQYSGYVVSLNDAQLAQLIEKLRTIIDERYDDIRIYHVPPRCKVWTLGRQALPEGVEVDAELAARLLLDAVEATDTAPVP